jgi:hypothetical protein
MPGPPVSDSDARPRNAGPARPRQESIRPRRTGQPRKWPRVRSFVRCNTLRLPNLKQRDSAGESDCRSPAPQPQPRSGAGSNLRHEVVTNHTDATAPRCTPAVANTVTLKPGPTRNGVTVPVSLRPAAGRAAAALKTYAFDSDSVADATRMDR